MQGIRLLSVVALGVLATGSAGATTSVGSLGPQSAATSYGSNTFSATISSSAKTSGHCEDDDCGHPPPPPVPEADTWVMLLVGSGLVAYQLRRKQRAVSRTLTLD